MPKDLIALREQLAQRIRDRERNATQVKGLVQQSRIAQYGASGHESENRNPVTRQQVKELVHRGHDMAHPMEMDPAQIVVQDCPELHDMRRKLKVKDHKIKEAQKEKAHNGTWQETVGEKKCKKPVKRCRKGSHVDHLHEAKHHIDGDVGHNQIH